MEQVSSLTKSLSDAQCAHVDNRVITYRLYTEAKPDLLSLIAFYFSGATLYPAAGMWRGQTEETTVIEIVGTLADLGNITALARDIVSENMQTSVLVVYDGKRLDVSRRFGFATLTNEDTKEQPYQSHESAF